jgi:acetate kinase
MQILVLNAGSSSLKYAIIETDSSTTLARGLIERIGVPQAAYLRGEQIVKVLAMNHAQALIAIAKYENFSSVEAIGHRVVHGGLTFTAPSKIDDLVLSVLEQNAKFAPLHNPANIIGIKAAREILPALENVAVFDTAFHASLPEQAYLYAIPPEAGLRRFGFHGTSHGFVAAQAAKFLEQPLEKLKLISLHIGNGASACAIGYGKSIDTSMGFTPLEGLVMGTRSGDIDAGLVLELVRRNGIEATDALLNKQSGMLGLSGAADLRDVWKAFDAGSQKAQTALDIFAYRIQKTIGAYVAALEGIDAIIFTAGVGENDSRMRAKIIKKMGWLGITLDETANQSKATRISSADSKVAALVIPTNEELAIALETKKLLNYNFITRPKNQAQN